jgi:probable rRNA maturation factor
MAINFFNEDISFKLPSKDVVKLKKWIKCTVEEEGLRVKDINYILCSDDYLLKINIDYLEHDTYTDVVTFDNSEEDDDKIIGDIFISVDRVVDNAKTFNISTEQELYRVIIHGTLHLCGYYDKEPDDKSLMTEKEDYYLNKLQDM